MKTTFQLCTAASALLIPLLQSCTNGQPQELPNILWITSEDNGPFLGCYGDDLATTPNLDRLAEEGFLYTHAYANAPVSAAVRSTAITGIYSCSGGCHQMRSRYLKSDLIRCYPEFLREAGYYCTNNSKEDYNFNPAQSRGLWDESSKQAHYKNRRPGQPFFAVFNTTLTHESSIHRSIPTDKLRHDPDKVVLPPYHPDTPELRHDWAQYYDKVEEMDAWVGQLLKELEESGEMENTIVIYNSDHGGVLPRSKRFVYESGTRVPFIIRIPEKFKHLYPARKPGKKVDRLISAVDMAPTFLSIASIPVPDWMQGKAFLGKQKTADPQYVYMFRNRMDERPDMCRAVRDNQFRYIRNYMPHRIGGQHVEFLWRAPATVSWEKAYKAGECDAAQSLFWQIKPSEELYDTQNDPWEVHNLADDPDYQDVLQRMRAACDGWMTDIKDADLIPEAEYAGINRTMSLYDYMRSGTFPFDKVMKMAGLASSRDKRNIPAFITGLDDEEMAVRYWAAMGLLILDQDAMPARPELQSALHDASSSVAVVAAEALYRLGEKDLAEQRLLEALEDENNWVVNQTLIVLDLLEVDTPAIRKAVKHVADSPNDNKYVLRMANRLLSK